MAVCLSFLIAILSLTSFAQNPPEPSGHSEREGEAPTALPVEGATQAPIIAIGIDEKLGTTIPMDLFFTNEDGAKVTFRELTGGKPFLLSLVYYQCKEICSPLLSGVAEVIDRTHKKLGQDYVALTLSFDPNDTVETAKAKKKNVLETMQNKPTAWHWLVGDAENIGRITEAVGFQYKTTEAGFAHSATIMTLSPEGKISRYLYGITFLPFDLEMALVEASEGRVGPTITKVLKYCFSYDPAGRKYVFNMTKVVGTLMLIVAGGYVLYLTRVGRARKKKQLSS